MKYKITGQIREKETGLPVKGLKVRAYDKDLLWDYLLGTATTDQEGKFEMDYSSKDFRELWEARPEIYLMVYAPPRTLLLRTEDSVRAGAKEEEHFDLEITRETLGPFSPLPSNDAPMLPERLDELEGHPAKTDLPQGVMVEIDRFYPGIDNAIEPRLWKDEQTGAFIIEAPFILKHREFPPIEAESIDAQKIQSIEVKAELDGNLPDHLPIRFRPELFQRPREIEPGLDIPDFVFPPDTRYIYRDTSFPWSTVGRVDTENGYCTGTMIGRRLMLTANHCIAWKGNGAGWVKFTWQHLGYPSDLSGGQRPAFFGGGAITSVELRNTAGQEGFVLGHFMDVVGGHSGGPYWGWWDGEPWPRVVGDHSTSPSTPGTDTAGDNEAGGGPALSSLISYARTNYP